MTQSRTPHQPPSVPIACSLTPGDLAHRLAWIAELNRAYLLTHRQDGRVLELTYARVARPQVRELIRREAECCPFLSFELADRGDLVQVRITAPPSVRESTDVRWLDCHLTDCCRLSPSTIQHSRSRKEGPMKGVVFYSALLLGVAACSSEDSVTEPSIPAEPSAAAATAAAANTWTMRSAYVSDYGLYGSSEALAPNSAGEPVVYLLGATEEGFDVGYPVQAYNAATDTWTQQASTTEVWHSNGAAKIGSKIYFSGGKTVTDDFDFSYSRETWAYDYGRDRMIRLADLPIRSAEGVSGVINNKLYVLPGRCWSQGFPAPGTCSTAPSRRFYSYDPATGRWSTRPWAPHFHAEGASAVIDGKLYVVGGASRDLDVYDPVTNRWTTRAPIPAAGRAIGAAIAGRFFVIVGSSLHDLQSYEYNPVTNVWRSRARPRWSHDGVVRVTLDGTAHLIAVGGGHGSGTEYPNESELYTR